MKWIATAFAALLLAVLTLSIPAPVFTTEASADGRMTGIGNCSGGVCTKVTCPAGTCSRAGTSNAIDVRYCSAANCRKK
jgi:hypothetical protein